MQKRTVILVAVLLLGCAGSAFSLEQLVVQKDRKFSQRFLTVKAGDAVVFKNEDKVSHNVYSASPGQSFDLRIQKPGQTAMHAFTAAGVVDVHCAIHPGMKLKVTVVP